MEHPIISRRSFLETGARVGAAFVGRILFMKPELLGIHHVTAVTANARDNYRFYTNVLGMRLVKKTVNQDDVSAYHLFYADAKGSPGSDLTFFNWAYTPRQRHGNNSVSRTALRVGGVESLRWWAARFDQLKVARSEIKECDGRAIMEFEDSEGQQLSLVDDETAGESFPWSGSPVPAEYQVRGLGPVAITIPELDLTDQLLTEVLGMRSARKYPDPADTRFSIHVYEVAGGGPGADLHVRVRPNLAPYRPGAGGVHHIAFRVADEETHHAWARRLRDFHILHSGEIDRYYFRSLYFREPNQVLFELATDGPGFAVDESLSDLGKSLALPPFLEGRRAEIEANLEEL
jgi:glyoxalase family protein